MQLRFMKRIIPYLNKINAHFGPDNRFIKLQEECQEFLDSRALEEVADVFIVAASMVLTSPVLMKIVLEKIARTIARIANGYYDIKGD